MKRIVTIKEAKEIYLILAKSVKFAIPKDLCEYIKLFFLASFSQSYSQSDSGRYITTEVRSCSVAVMFCAMLEPCLCDLRLFILKMKL